MNFLENSRQECNEKKQLLLQVVTENSQIQIYVKTKNIAKRSLMYLGIAVKFEGVFLL